MTTMKIGWGARVALLYGGFVVLIAVLVTMSMKQELQLVSTEYYQEELQYQQVIDAYQNQTALSEPTKVLTKDDHLIIQLPAQFENSGVSGTVEFYAYADKTWDRSFELGGRLTAIPKETLRPTRYKVKINWKSEGKNYYQETSLNLHTNG